MLYKLAINNPYALADVMVIRLPVCLFIVEEVNNTKTLSPSTRI
jgi:hypothetical protein